MSDYPQDFVTVFRGSMSAALSLQVSLEAGGLHPIIPGHYTYTIYPFITGGNVFEVKLQTPASEAGSAFSPVRRSSDPSVRP